MKKWIRKQFRKKPRVYIVPTKMGGYLNGLIFLMFLMAVGYSNNLLLIFTIFLFSFNLIWLIQSHFHLYRLKPDNVVISAGHAGSKVNARVFWKTAPKRPWSWQIQLESDRGDFALGDLKDGDSCSEGELSPDKRGVYKWEYLHVKTDNPFGLYQLWIYYPLNLTSLVYPTLLPVADLSLSGNSLEGDSFLDKKGADEFRGLGAYDNDESRKISWKHYARSGELLIKEGEEKTTPVLELEFRPPTELALKEHYLSTLATQMVECQKQNIPFSLRVNGQESGQLRDCLKVLALC